jgi:hypothetical protein
MKATISSTTKIITLNGVPARIWEGETESGIKIHCFITRLAINKDEPRAYEFEKELQSQNPPSREIEVYPLRMLL